MTGDLYTEKFKQQYDFSDVSTVIIIQCGVCVEELKFNTFEDNIKFRIGYQWKN